MTNVHGKPRSSLRDVETGCCGPVCVDYILHILGAAGRASMPSQHNLHTLTVDEPRFKLLE